MEVFKRKDVNADAGLYNDSESDSEDVEADDDVISSIAAV